MCTLSPLTLPGSNPASIPNQLCLLFCFPQPRPMATVTLFSKRLLRLIILQVERVFSTCAATKNSGVLGWLIAIWRFPAKHCSLTSLFKSRFSFTQYDFVFSCYTNMIFKKSLAWLKTHTRLIVSSGDTQLMGNDKAFKNKIKIAQRSLKCWTNEPWLGGGACRVRS